MQMIYITIYLISAILAGYAQKQFKRGNKLIGVLISLLAIILASVFAGLRSVMMGTDNITYSDYFSTVRSTSTLVEALTNSFLIRANLGKLFIIINYIVSRFTDKYYWFSIFASFITVLFIYLGAYKRRNNSSMFFVMLAFFFMFYGNTWNIVRQGLTLSIVFFASYYIENGKYLKYLLLIIAAGLIHEVAFFGGTLLGFSYMFIRKQSKIREFLLVTIFIFLLVFFKEILSIAVLFSPTIEKYIDIVSSGFSFSLGSTAATLERIPFILFSSLFYRQLKTNKMFRIYFIFLIIDLILAQFGVYYGPMYRLSLYFGYFKLLLIPMFINLFNTKKSQYNLIFVQAIAIIAMIAYWVIYVVFNFYGFLRPVYPYTTDLIRMILY